MQHILSEEFSQEMLQRLAQGQKDTAETELAA